MTSMYEPNPVKNEGETVGRRRQVGAKVLGGFFSRARRERRRLEVVCSDAHSPS